MINIMVSILNRKYSKILNFDMLSQNIIQASLLKKY